MTTPPTDNVKPLRKLIHLAGAAFPLLYLVTSRQLVLIVTLVALVLMVAIELARRRSPALERVFEWLIGSALRPGEERQPTAGLWSMVGILITLLFFDRAFAIPALLYAQVGDPAAEIVGRRWGRHRWRNGKSWEGSFACFVVSLVLGLALSQMLPLSSFVAALGALAATVEEAVTLPLGDNLLMAPVAALAMNLVDWII